MIRTIIELYGELERFKNYAQRLLSELEIIDEESRNFPLFLKDVEQFITDWENSGLNYLDVDFDPDIDAYIFYASNCLKDLKKLLRDHEDKFLVKESLEEFIGYIVDVQLHIADHYTKDEDLYSNRVLQSQFKKLMESYDYFLYVLTRKILSKIPTAKVHLEYYDRPDVMDFVNKFVEFANALNINVTPHAFYSLIEPMF